MNGTNFKSATLGFIGLGVMGEPMCANLARKSGRPVHATDIRREPVERLASAGVTGSGSVAAVAAAADIIFLSLPSGVEVEQVCFGTGGIVPSGGRVHIVVDMSTTSVKSTREIAGRLMQRGIAFADAPVARTRQAARDGTLSIMVGGSADMLEAIRPLLACMGSEINHCGDIGAG